MATKARGVRIRKLNNRHPIQIFREDEIAADEYEASLTQLATVSTGVESNEETEFHLQAIISNSLQAKDQEIPTGEKAQPSILKYDEVYDHRFTPPNHYLAFSQSVEEVTGVQYDMSSEDAAWLKTFNKGRHKSSLLSEDDFEKIMAALEEYAELHTPFAAVDNTVPPWADIEVYIKQELSEERLHSFSKDMYEHWRDRKQRADKGHIQPCLKLEVQQAQQGEDDTDPYVCFRRREVRQTRKTRARDQQSAASTRNLRMNLEGGRTLIKMAIERDKLKLNMVQLDNQIFLQRAEVKDVKMFLGVKTDDEDLFSLPQKRKAVDAHQMQRPHPGSIKFPSRGDGRAPDAEFQLLTEKNAEKENALQEAVAKQVAHHQVYNQGWIDCTREPLSPVHEQGVEGFRPATASYLMTPPASASEESMNDQSLATEYNKQEFVSNMGTALNCLSAEDQRSQPAYRRRWGRGNRLWIDRRGLPSPAKDIDPNDRVIDRFKFDQDDDEEQPVYNIDPYSFEQMKFRTSIPISQHFPQRRGMLPGGNQSSPSNRSGHSSQLRQPSQSIPSVT